MFNIKSSQTHRFAKESGNAIVIVLVVLVVVAVGALAYMSGQMTGEEKTPDIIADTAMQESDTTQQADASEGKTPEEVIKPGNPVVAKVGDHDITRTEVFQYIQQLPPNARQLPIEQLFPAAMEQVINNAVINDKTKGIKLDDDPEVKKQVAAAKDNIVRTVYIQNQISKRITDERLKEAYSEYVKNLPEVEEVKARHILVKEESLAKKIISELEDGGDFAALAKENSTDGTAASGGELGYFAKADVVPAFSEAAFATEPGAFTTKPVETEFGFHVIKVEDKRMRKPAEFEAAKPFLETQMRRAVLDELISEWRETSGVQRFDINGEEIEPASGEEAPAAASK